MVEHLKNECRLTALVAHRNVARLAEQARQYQPDYAVIADPARRDELKSALAGSGVKVLAGPEGMLHVATRRAANTVVMALSGTLGLLPTLAALEQGKRVAIANKEIIVGYGRIIMARARQHGAEILPIDSELSAIHQCLGNAPGREVARIILTASGGPFLHRRDLSRITVRQALQHPTWRMGRKTTVDSATLMNKGLEVIETAMYFDVPPAKIEVLVHPQSIVHSLVEFCDHSILAQLALPDMRLPIQYALTWPRRTTALVARTRLEDLKDISFDVPDLKRFPCLSLAMSALRAGGVQPCVLNQANEQAVGAFLAGRLTWPGIPEVTARTLRAVPDCGNPGLSRLQAAERAAAVTADKIIDKLNKE